MGTPAQVAVIVGLRTPHDQGTARFDPLGQLRLVDAGAGPTLPSWWRPFDAAW